MKLSEHLCPNNLAHVLYTTLMVDLEINGWWIGQDISGAFNLKRSKGLVLFILPIWVVPSSKCVISEVNELWSFIQLWFMMIDHDSWARGWEYYHVGSIKVSMFRINASLSSKNKRINEFCYLLVWYNKNFGLGGKKCSHVWYMWENVGKRSFGLFIVLASSGLKIGEGKKNI